MKKSIGIFLTSLLTISAIAFAPASTAAGATDSYWGATATATTNYNGYEASFATGAPDATFCGDISGQAWTYYEPYVDSQLVVELAEPMSGTELAVYFSNDLEDLIRIELAFEHHRWHDLTRFFNANDLVTYMKSKSQADFDNSPLSNFTSKDYYFPIPYNEYKLDPLLMYQNPGY